MRAYDIISKKRDGQVLTEQEIKFMIDGYVNNSIPDYQMAAFLMAIYLKNMTEEEYCNLTKIMLNSGEVIDLSSINGVKVDKHSTGGVGDKITLIVAPVVAACGVKVAKMSGRGLGHTGGTIDKLESIKNFKVELNKNEFFDIVNKVGCCVIGQTGNLVPADKKIYALRDVTATIESIPLIASSIMSKKLASGADCILLDVKVGDGAFMKSIEQATELSIAMVKIGKKLGKKVEAVITNMDQPLGYAIGNILEVLESYEVLKNFCPEDLKEVSNYVAARMLYMANFGTFEECLNKVEEVLKNGSALQKFKDMITAQGGDVSIFEKININNFDNNQQKYICYSENSGYISAIKASQIGTAAMILGAGRQKKEDTIDYNSGIILGKKVGDKVEKGEILGTLYSKDINKCKLAENIFKQSFVISNTKPEKTDFVYKIITEKDI